MPFSLLMWQPKKIVSKTRNVKTHYTNPPNGLDITEVWFDDILFCNAAEHIYAPVAYQTQLIICEHCFIDSCEDGNQVVFRRADSFVFILPSFTEMAEWIEDHKDTTTETNRERPPEYIMQRGSIFLTKTQYEKVCTLIPSFPPFNEIISLGSKEVVRLIQSESPYQLLGKFPNKPILNQALVLESNTAEPINDLCQQIQQTLDRYWMQDIPVTLCPPDVPNELYLNTAVFTQWTEFVFKESQVHLQLQAFQFSIAP